ncbi:MAG TPA: T9SS type A sorting domain-containing protein [Catalimonadaceae bacterium]|nr:T9SS type A sorting domain-containing protein [Catalimonadaceae bacterium]
MSSGTGIWTLISGSGSIENSSSPNSLVTNLGNGQNVFRWTVTNPPCSQTTDDVIITNLGNATIAQAGENQTLCNTQATLAGNTATFGIGQWSLVSGTGTITSPTSPTSTVTGLGTGLNVFRWTITNGNCPPSFDDVVVTRVPAPSVAFAGTDQNICTNSATLAATTPSIGNGLWTLVSGSGQIQDVFNPQTQVTGLGTGANTFRWTISNSPCAASTDEVIINSTTNAVAAVAGQDQVLCSESTQLSGNNAGTGTGTWTVVSGSGTFTNANSPTTQVTALGAGMNVFRWTIINGTCPTSSDDVNVERINSVSLSIAGIDQNLCTSTATLSGNVPQAGTGLWTLVSGTGTITNPSDPNTTVTGLGNGANVFRWTITNIPCAASADEVVISTTLSAVTANAGTDQTVCGSVSQLIGNNPGTGTGVWALVSGSGNITNPNGSLTSVTGLGAGVNVFSWTVTSGVCQPSVDQVQITVVNNPVAANAGNDQTICGSSATLTGNTPTQGTGSWSLVSGSGTIANLTSASTTVIGLGNGANIFRWTISNAPCAPTFDEIIINATPGNVTALAGADKTICGSSTFLNATAPVTGFGVWSLVSGSGTIAQPGNPVSEVTNLGSGVNTFAWTVTSGSCTASDLVQVTKEINTLDLGPDSLACIGTSVVLNAGTGFADYSWFDNSGTPTVTVGASGQYWVQVLSNNGCTFRDTIKVTFVICTDVEQTLTKSDVLEIYPNPGDGFFHLNFESATAAKSTVRMYNSTGVQVLEKELDLTDGKASQDLDLRGTPAGLYIMEVQNDKVRHIRKLIVR